MDSKWWERLTDVKIIKQDMHKTEGMVLVGGMRFRRCLVKLWEPTEDDYERFEDWCDRENRPDEIVYFKMTKCQEPFRPNRYYMLGYLEFKKCMCRGGVIRCFGLERLIVMRVKGGQQMGIGYIGYKGIKNSTNWNCEGGSRKRQGVKPSQRERKLDEAKEGIKDLLDNVMRE